MSENETVVKICVEQTDDRLDSSKLCGTLKRVPLESLDEKNKSIEV
jgi:hypothetical protein